MLKKKKNQKGFTLIELLVVIAIIGILAVVAVPALFNNINKAKVADLKSDYNAYKSASLAYYTDNSALPTSAQNKGTVGTEVSIKPTATQLGGDQLKKVLGSYMDNVPVKSPFGTPYIMDDTNGTLTLKTTYTKAKDDTKLQEAIEKDTNGLVTVNDTTGEITMTLISSSVK